MEYLLLVPVAGGFVFTILCAIACFRFYHQPVPPAELAPQFQPRVTLLKPIHGLEKNLSGNLRSACTQDYPDYQVIFSVQNPDDPALPLLRELETEFGPDRVSLVVIESTPVVNGKVQNLINAMTACKYDYIVISDSDVLLEPDYLKAIIAPLSDPGTGYVCTLYRGTCADTWYEHLEQLTYNADFIPSVIFSYMTHASSFCLGASIAFRRSTLAAVGGFEDLADYLVEDYELGRRILASGARAVLVRHHVDLITDLKSPLNWWQHQLYWDQNTWAAQPLGFFLTILTKGIPFSILYGLVNAFNFSSLLIILSMLAVRLGTVAYMLKYIQGNYSAVDLMLLPVRDCASLLSWFAAISKRKFIWRGHEFLLTRGGRIVPRSL